MNLRLPLTSDPEGMYVFDADGRMVFELRGWGHLQYQGEEKAVQEQKERAQFICETVNRIAELEAELTRLKRGEFTPEEFQRLCHHWDERPGCTREAFEQGCREYQKKLFGEGTCETGVSVEEKVICALRKPEEQRLEMNAKLERSLARSRLRGQVSAEHFQPNQSPAETYRWVNSDDESITNP